MNNIEKHKRFLALLSAGVAVPRDLAEWYQSAFRRHETEGLPLCVCLGLRGPGLRSARQRDLMRERDVLLMGMTGSVRCRFDDGLWQRCGIVADLVQRYPRSKNEHNLLRPIFALGVTVPSTQSGIYKRVLPLRGGNKW